MYIQGVVQGGGIAGVPTWGIASLVYPGIYPSLVPPGYISLPVPPGWVTLLYVPALITSLLGNPALITSLLGNPASWSPGWVTLPPGLLGG